MKNLLLILFLLLSTSLSAEYYNVGGNTYFDIPSNWSKNFDVSTLSSSFLSPSGLVRVDIVAQPYSTDNQSIYYEDYDALSAIFTPFLGLSELNSLKNWTNAGSQPYSIGVPQISSGPSLNYNFYVLSSLNTYQVSLTGPGSSLSGNVFTSVQGHYIFWDGKTMYTAKSSINIDFAPDSEKEELFSIIGSGFSTFIPNPLGDSDGDGILDFDEAIFYGSNPNQIDSNGDGINDDVITSLGGHPNWDLTAALESIGQNPSDYNLNLHSLSDIQDLRTGSTMIEIHNGQATLTMEVEESDDLGIWTTGGTASVQINVQPGEDKKFFRFKMDDSDSSSDETGVEIPLSYVDLVVNLSSEGSYDFISVNNHPLNDYNGVYYTQPDLINNMPYFKSSNQKYLYFYKGASGGLLSWSFYNALPDGISDLFTGGWIQPYPVLESGNFNIFEVAPE